MANPKTKDELLHALAREVVATLPNPDRKQLRYNEIVDVAQAFYNNPRVGVCELVEACCKDNAALYVKGNPMWQSLKENYKWMLVS